MEICDQSFLVLDRSGDSLTHTIRIESELTKTLSSWGPSTRISPIAGISLFGTHRLSTYSFEGVSFLLFLGPMDPQTLLDLPYKKCKVWLGLGTFNIVINIEDSAIFQSLISWVKGKNFRYEYWEIKDGQIVKYNFSQSVSDDRQWVTILENISDLQISTEIREAVTEYCPLMSSAISRYKQVFHDESPNLKNLNMFFYEILNDLSKLGERLYPVLGILKNTSAGLSRFSSQTFSGITPIIETECHFWSHSLLGVGIASIALSNLESFIQNTLGEQRIPQRFQLYLNKPRIDLHKLNISDELWYKDHLSTISLDEINKDPIVPLLTYFSGRDGYKSTYTTLSAPLSTVSACNSYPWSLMTVTHEISHTIVQGVLGFLYPDLNSNASITKTWEMMRDESLSKNLFESIQRYLSMSILKIETASLAIKTQVDFDPSKFKFYLDKWHHEVEETMVHVFDFLYFYAQDIELYVQGIWLSWSVIPNIKNRISEYLTRTICAVLSINLRRGSDSEDIAMTFVRKQLEDLTKSKTSKSSFIQETLDYLDKQWEDEIKPKVIARKPLVKIVRTFIFSKEIATILGYETRISKPTPKYKGYNLKPKQFAFNSIDNPIRFIKLYTNSIEPSSSVSFWMLYILAFNLTKK